jgi:protein YIPF6
MLSASLPAPSQAPQSTQSLSTLDEPVSVTIMRDLKAIGEKIKYVMLPTSRHDKMRGLRDWDLWGPFILCIVLSLLLSSQAGTSQSGYVFAIVFILVWAGSAVVTVNASLLQGRVSFFQSVCVLGYCIAPLVIAAVICGLLTQLGLSWFKLLVVMAGFAWSTTSSVGFMSELLPEDRKLLGVYPVFLFYFAMAWVILVA